MTAINTRTVTRLFAALVLVAGISGCKQPTEIQQVADIRPGINFKLASASESDAQTWKVFIDGLEVGHVANYLAGQSVLRVLSGTHVVRVESPRGVLLDERVYLGDGSIRSFSLL